ncbi:glycosyltransferase [Methylocapsa acidiphila]|uniref:glycosyltransferase n=1 Tax=Methylocapsa acidiphila TaxID=133552 RepID=UPI000417B519|nr:glycosyltransferase [Methylocapsa acidiphila]
MKILLNAVSIKEGGATVVLLKRLASLRRLRPDIEWIVVANANARFDPTPDPKVTWILTSWIDKSAVHAFFWYEFVLPSLVREHRPDLVFSQTNFLPLQRLPCPTLLLVQHAGYYSEAFKGLMKDWKGSLLAGAIWALRSAWVRHSVRAATSVTVQTRALAEAIDACGNRRADDLSLIAEGPGLAQPLDAPRAHERPDVFRIGYVTNWGVQKNFTTLFHAARSLRDSGRRFKIVLTLSEQDPRCQGIFAAAREIGVENLIENHGLVSQDKIAEIYDGLDIFAFPSLCESFGLPMIEAMAHGLPIVVAATPENIEMTQDAGLSFAPMDATELATHLAKLIDDDEERAKRGELSLARSRDFSWETTAEQTIRAFEQTLEKADRAAQRPDLSPTPAFGENAASLFPTFGRAAPRTPASPSAALSRRAAMSANYQMSEFVPPK